MARAAASPSLFDAAPRAAGSSAACPPAPPPPDPARPPVDEPDHHCAVCGEPAGFGFGVFLRRGLEGRWSCMAHRDQVEAAAE